MVVFIQYKMTWGIHMVKMIQTPPYPRALTFFSFMYMVFSFCTRFVIIILGKIELTSIFFFYAL